MLQRPIALYDAVTIEVILSRPVDEASRRGVRAPLSMSNNSTLAARVMRGLNYGMLRHYSGRN